MAGATEQMVRIGKGKANPLKLLEEHVLVDGRAALAAELLRPTHPEPAVRGDLLEGLGVLLAAGARVEVPQLLGKLWGHDRGEVRAELVA